MEKVVKTVAKTDGKMTVYAQNGEHEVIMDQPVDANGQNKGPTPVEMVLTALAGCKLMVAQGFAMKNGFETGEMQCEVSMDFGKFQETGKCDFKVKMTIPGCPEELRDKMEKFVHRGCPVAKILEADNTVETDFEFK